MLKRCFKSLLIFTSTVVALANILGVCWFWSWLKDFEAKRSALQFNFSEYLAMQANQNSILQIYLVIFSLVLAFLAFYGFFQIKEAAEKTAERKAEEIAKSMVEQFLKEKEDLNLGNPSFPYNKDDDIEKRGGADE